MPSSILIRVAASLLGGAAALLALPAAAQQAQIGYSTAVPGAPAASEMHQTNTRIVIQHWDRDNRLLTTSICRGPRSCQPSIPNGSARFAMALEYDSAREELVGSSCGGVADTVPQGQCINASLRVSMRLRHGTVEWRFAPDPRPGKDISAPSFGSFAGSPARLEFPSTDGTTGSKHWEPRTFTSTRSGFPTPAGDYDVVIPEMSGACKPVHTNPGERLSVREGQTTVFTVRYTGTVCTMSIRSYSSTNVPATAGTFTSQPAGLQCDARQLGPNNCKAEFAFDSTVRLIGNPAVGYTTSFGRNFTGCSRNEPDQKICEILADGDRELSASFEAAAAPPPPPPVAVAASAGTNPPADATVAKGSNAVAMLQVLLTPANGIARVQALTLQASGSGRDDMDLTDLRVYNDSNRNGRVDAGEALLSSGRVAADNGTLRLPLATPLEFSQPVQLLVVADIASSVNVAAAAAVAAGGGTLFALFAGLLAPRRLRRVQVTGRGRAWLVGAVLVSAVGLNGCGGNDEPDAEPPASAPPPVVVVPPAPPPPVLVTYRLQLTAVQATDTATAPAPLSLSTLPITGAVITVQR